MLHWETNFQLHSLNALTVILCGSETLIRRLGLSILGSLAITITIGVATARAT
jgi:hypothetical protein